MGKRNEEEKLLADLLDETLKEDKKDGIQVPETEFQMILSEMEKRGIVPQIYKEMELVRKWKLKKDD